MEMIRPKINDVEAFRKALEHYRVSDHGKRILEATPFVAVTGLAGGGRNTVFRRLVEKYNYGFAISDTTRPPKFRDGRMEQNGVDYYFRKEEDMLHDIQNGEFIEAEIIHNQQVSGTSIREIERVVAMKRIPIHDFEYGGAEAVHLAKSDASIIGLLPPSYEEWIRRFRNRETIHEEEFLNRLRTAQVVLQHILERPYYSIVINDDVEECAEDIHKIVALNDYSSETKHERRKIAEEILRHVEDALR